MVTSLKKRCYIVGHFDQVASPKVVVGFLLPGPLLVYRTISLLHLHWERPLSLSGMVNA